MPQEKVPKIGATGERYREKQLAYQLPKQDLALNYCKHIESQHNSSYEDFVSGRNEIALDIAYIKDASSPSRCVNVKCDATIVQGHMAVIAPKFREEVCFLYSKYLFQSAHTMSSNLIYFACRCCGIQNVSPAVPVMSF